MTNLSAVLRSFSAGAAGGVANVILLVIYWHFRPGPELTHNFLKDLLYRQMVWGGIWGFAFLIPVMARAWVLRGVIWGAAATVVAVFVFGAGHHVTVMGFILGLVVNSGAWGLTASWLYYASGKVPARA